MLNEEKEYTQNLKINKYKDGYSYLYCIKQKKGLTKKKLLHELKSFLTAFENENTDNEKELTDIILHVFERNPHKYRVYNLRKLLTKKFGFNEINKWTYSDMVKTLKKLTDDGELKYDAINCCWSRRTKVRRLSNGNEHISDRRSP